MSDNQALAISRIINADIVLRHFGCWPAFHDAEVIQVTLEVLPTDRAAATFVIVASGYRAQTDEQGNFQRAGNCQVTLQFVGIKELNIDYFGLQNVIFNLLFEEAGTDIQCTFDSSAGMSACLVAEGVVVLDLIPTKR